MCVCGWVYNAYCIYVYKEGYIEKMLKNKTEICTLS